MSELAGPRAKVERAKSQLIALNKVTNDFFEAHRYSVVRAEFDRKAGQYSLRIKECPPNFPIEWSVVIGEIAHNLRSALDGLAWQLALLNTTSMPFQRTAFPIRTFSNGTRRPRIDGGYDHPFWYNGIPCHLLKSIDRCFWTRIEAFQPYKGRNRGRHHPLFLLHELNNTDKHRLIMVLATVLSGWMVTGLSGKITLKRGVSLKPNAKVASALPLPPEGVTVFDFNTMGIARQYEMQVDFKVIPEIRFGNSCDAVKGLPVISTLNHLLNKVSSIVESFANDF